MDPTVGRPAAATPATRPEADAPARGPPDSPVPVVARAPRTRTAVSGRVDPCVTHASSNDSTGDATLGLTLRLVAMERDPAHHLRFQSSRDGTESSIPRGP